MWFTCPAGIEQKRDVVTSLRAYLSAPNHDLLLPPWSPEWQSLPEADRKRYELARESLDRILQLDVEALNDPEVRAAHVEMLNALMKQRGESKAALEKYQKALKRRREQLLAELRSADQKNFDPKVLELWEKLNKVPNEREDDNPIDDAPRPNPEREDIRSQLAERMGRLTPSAKSLAANYGVVLKKGDEVQLESLRFARWDEGFSAMLQWLADKGCAAIRYDLQALGTHDPDD